MYGDYRQLTIGNASGYNYGNPLNYTGKHPDMTNGFFLGGHAGGYNAEKTGIFFDRSGNLYVAGDSLVWRKVWTEGNFNLSNYYTKN